MKRTKKKIVDIWPVALVVVLFIVVGSIAKFWGNDDDVSDAIRDVAREERASQGLNPYRSEETTNRSQPSSGYGDVEAKEKELGPGPGPMAGKENQEIVERSEEREEQPEREVSELGPTAWMAVAEDIDLDEIEERLAEGRWEQEFELSLREDRNRSTRVAEAAAKSCYESLQQRQPAITGRIALEWELRTDAGRAVIESPRILYNLGLHDVEFEKCVVESLRGVEFDASGDGGELVVQWAGFFND